MIYCFSDFLLPPFIGPRMILLGGKMNSFKFNLFTIFFLFFYQAGAVRPDLKNLPIGLTPAEVQIQESTRELFVPVAGRSPVSGVIHSLGEWEEAAEVLTLWPNPSYMKALSENGKVRLFADSDSEKSWWQNWITKNNLNPNQFSFFVVPTDSIWVRDYGPWPIVDSQGQFGLVDTVYNRPRPQDDRLPDFIGRSLSLPVYKIGLVHTGGNYYSDGLGNAFSSTLVFTENSKLGQQEIFKRMFDFLGIHRYTTSRLSPQITIEHLDTFGKLVAPDTWVFSQFPPNSRHFADSERMVELLKTLTSPYGTPYKIHRLKMSVIPGSSGEDYRAYINSFISNKTLFFPTYGDQLDKAAEQVYQQALPGYKIVGVQNGSTEWGDSVHCRSRNLVQHDTVFVFPKIAPETLVEGQRILVNAHVYPSPGATLGPVVLSWKINEGPFQEINMEHLGGYNYSVELPAQDAGNKVSLFIKTQDSRGKVKTAPIQAPSMTIDAVIQNSAGI